MPAPLLFSYVSQQEDSMTRHIASAGMAWFRCSRLCCSRRRQWFPTCADAARYPHRLLHT